MAAPTREVFRIAVARVLNSWTVLKLAVSHGFGGAESEAKAEWMVTAVDQWFSENANIETYELEDFLEDVLDAEFNTIADDGSLPEIARMICGFFRLCQSGEEAKLQEQLAKLPPSNLEGCQQVPGAQNGSCQEGESDEDVGTEPNTPLPLVPVQQSASGNHTESMETESVEGGAVDSDGWTMVTSKKNKRR